jgi:hypothetical protein
MTYTLTRNYSGYGGGLLSPDCRRFYVNISKNASSYMVDTLSRQGWTAAVYGKNDCSWDQIEKMLIILREPVDRWCSGVAQYLMTRILNSVGYQSHFDDESVYRTEDMPLSAPAFLAAYNNIIERFIFDNLDLLDDHVWQQHEFFRNILPDVDKHYIVIDDNLDQKLQAWGLQTFSDADRNSSSQSLDQSVLKEFFQKKLNSRPDLMKMVRNTYARDYEIISQIWIPGETGPNFDNETQHGK